MTLCRLSGADITLPLPICSRQRLVGAVSVLAENYGSVHVRLLGVHSLRAAVGSSCTGLSSCRLAADVLRRQLAGGRLSASCLLLAALQLAGGREQLRQLVQLASFIGRQLAAARPQLSVEGQWRRGDSTAAAGDKTGLLKGL